MRLLATTVSIVKKAKGRALAWARPFKPAKAVLS
jgi:hypothetical protein